MGSGRRPPQGVDLIEEQRGKLRAYYGRYSRQKQSVHLKADRLAEWQDLASHQGVALSSGIQDHVVRALQGPGAVVQELREENQRLRDEVGALRGTSGHLAVENSKLQSRLEAIGLDGTR